MADPLISIVMPSFNQVRFIERSILSVLNQNYPNVELIVIDGGSQDGTIEILKKYEKRLAYWESVPDNGQSHALNKGFKKIRGEICGWLNFDDLYCDGSFRIAANILNANQSTRIVFGDCSIINEFDKEIEYFYSFDFNIKHFVYEGFHINAQASFWRASLQKEFGLFDEALHRTMDYDMLLRFGLIAGEKAFSRVNLPLACFRRHEEQKTQGFDETVKKEHRAIAFKNGFGLKNTPLLYVLRFPYRIRRIIWYLRRAGLRYAIKKFVRSKF